ncbi:hypothetical protein FQN57_007414 [Myotisia sp. PD_48]|nr:hypothetical protein FQN57_007414 [Myotisia sp. PD_48]
MPLSKRIVHRALYSFIYIVAFITSLLVQIGNVSDKPVLRQFYFLKVDVSDIIPQSVPNTVITNSIARTIGLHDFYQVGLWNFCEGYNDEGGITFCSKPKPMYYFNPVEIIMDELLSGATIALPNAIILALNVVRVASNWMFGLFLTSTILIFLCIFLAPFSIQLSSKTSSAPEYSSYYEAKRRNKILLPLSILSFCAFFTTTVASTVATAMFLIFKLVFANNGQDLNIRAELGVRTLAFMWISALCVFIGFIPQMRNLCRCCCSRFCFRSAARENRIGNESQNEQEMTVLQDTRTSGQGLNRGPQNNEKLGTHGNDAS